MNRCTRCGWPLYATVQEGCTPDNCAMRVREPRTSVNNVDSTTTVYLEHAVATWESEGGAVHE